MARQETFKTPLGRRLADVRKALGYEGRKEFADVIGTKPDTLGTYERGVSEPDAALLTTYRRRFGIDLSWLITGEGEMFCDPSKKPSPPIPVDQKTLQRLVDTIDQVAENTQPRPTYVSPRAQARPPKTLRYFPDHYVSAGGGNTSPYETTGEEIETLEELADRILDMRLDDMRVFRILGDSMFPTFASGDVVIANARHQEITEDTLYIVSIDGEMLVKRAQWGHDGALTWASDNPDSRYRPIRLEGDEINAAVVVGQVERMIIALPKRV